MREVFLLMMVFLISGPVCGQLSPGDLAKVHSHLEGISNCTRCHVLGQKVSSQKCLDCHTEIRDRVNAGKGYHASAGVRGKECVTCHSDHHGLNFQIIRFNREQFNHALTGYPLTGAHANRTCADCHKPEFIRDSKVRKKKTTFLGLGTGCLACHADYHQQTLPANCSDCHGDVAFKPALKFDHNRSAFRLAGRHRELPCEKCHRTGLRNDAKFQEFKGIRHDQCTDCHTDPHQGKFGAQCTQCHSEQSFSQIRGVENFDHSRTGFPLEGKHRGVKCQSCHKTRLTGGLSHSKCTDCHTDYHRGQLTRNGVTPDCSDCHTHEGFRDFTYGPDRHNAGSFPLRGAHLATPCFACHQKGAAGTDTAWRFRDLGARCVDCHPDIHRPAISEKYYPGSSCESCHRESRWSQVTFDHSLTGLVLQGRHAQIPCRSCHIREQNGRVAHAFSELTFTCSSCHADVHAGQFLLDGVTDCGRCHGEQAFRPAEKFSHARTRFPLEGKHAEVACEQCHKRIPGNGSSYVFYKIPEFKCENCHH